MIEPQDDPVAAATNPRQPSRNTGLREKLLDVAIDEFAQFGFAGARTSSISRAAGCSEPALFKYFRSKRSLFLACLEHAERAVDEEAERLLDAHAGPWDMWDDFLSHPQFIHRYHLMTAMRLLACGLRDEPDLQAELAAGTERLVATISATVQRGKDLGTVGPEIDPTQVAWTWIGLAFAGCYRCAIEGGTAADSTTFATMLREGAGLLSQVLEQEPR
jgi:AcrR family transcriptional regulator